MVSLVIDIQIEMVFMNLFTALILKRSYYANLQVHTFILGT